MLYEKLAIYHESNTSLHDNFSAAAREGEAVGVGSGRWLLATWNRFASYVGANISLRSLNTKLVLSVIFSVG